MNTARRQSVCIIASTFGVFGFVRPRRWFVGLVSRVDQLHTFVCRSVSQISCEALGQALR